MSMAGSGVNAINTEDLPDMVENWNEDHVTAFLSKHQSICRLTDADIQVIRNQGINGEDLLDLNALELVNCGVPIGPAKGTVRFIENLKVVKQIAVHEDQKRKLAEEASEHFRYMERLARLPAPNEMAGKWQQSSADPIFLDHRPASSIGLPTELLHPVFGGFLDDCRDAKPTAEDYIFTQDLSEAMSAYYQSEADRAKIFRKLFKKHFTITLNCVEIHGVTTDGTWLPNAEADFIALNAEVKGEPGASGDSHIQNMAFYKQYLYQNRESFAETTRLPCFLIQVHRTELSISTIIYGNKIIVDPYHFALILPCSPTRFESFARIFHALKKGLDALRSYYTGPPPRIPVTQRGFPYYASFSMLAADDNKGRIIRFTYHTALNSDPLSFLVDVLGNEESLPRRLLVKFTQRYPNQIHKRCADLRIAPKLYGFESLPGGWFMVVMDYMVGFQSLGELALGTGGFIRAGLRTKVQATITHLHNFGYVHGDIRDINVMVRPSKGFSPPDVVLVGWDWAGKDGQVNYPISINPEVRRHQDAIALRPIRQEHDIFMSERLFSGL